jgi:RNA polymerase sigma factor (TIGR02999 family)
MFSAGRVTALLVEWGDGNQAALDRLMPVVYAELRRMAARHLRRERPDHTLQPTALVHEAYLKLIDQRSVQWQNRAQFFGVAAQLMRRILVDHARARGATKRGSAMPKVTLDEAGELPAATAFDVLGVDQALNRLAAIDAEQARIVELRFFGGLSVEETAQVVHRSPRTIKREWRLARAWLHGELGSGPEQ